MRWTKSRKPITSRRPPEPSESHAEIGEGIRRVMPDLHPIVERLDAMIRESIPDLRYAIKWKKAYYGSPEHGWIIEMVAYDVSVNVVFFGGAGLDPPPPLGTTDRICYVKVKTPRGGAWSGDAQLGRASGTRGWLEMRLHLARRAQG